MNAALASNQHLTIVVVEDDAGMSKAHRAAATGGWFSSRVVCVAEELLKTEAADSAACLVLDIQLPRLSGLELGRFLVTSGRAKPVIFPDYAGLPKCGRKNGVGGQP